MSAKRRSAAARMRDRQRPHAERTRGSPGRPGPGTKAVRPASGPPALVFATPARRGIQRGKQTRSANLLDDVKHLVREMRTLFDSVINHYRLRVAARLAHIEDGLTHILVDGALTKEQLQDLDLMKAQTTDLDIAPQKGRRRDIRKIARIALRLEQIVDGWE